MEVVDILDEDRASDEDLVWWDYTALPQEPRSHAEHEKQFMLAEMAVQIFVHRVPNILLPNPTNKILISINFNITPF